MGLTKKVFLAFFVVIALSVAMGMIGYRSTASMYDVIDDTASRINPADRALARLSAALERSVTARRTLLSPQLTLEQRGRAHSDYEKAMGEFGEAKDFIDKLISENRDSVKGWRDLEKLMEAARPPLSNFIEHGNQIDDQFRAWEATCILNPDRLLANLQQYRGDHYNVLRRLALMVMAGVDDGAGDMSADDTLCAFGRWRVSFDRGDELYARNPVFRESMERMKEPHHRFHALAHELQAEVRKGDVSPARLREVFREVAGAADLVVGNFAAMSEEAAKAAKIANDAQNDTLVGIADSHAKAMEVLNAVIEKNRELAQTNDEAALEEGRSRRELLGVLIGVAMTVGLAMALLVAWFLRRDLTAPLRKAIESLSGEAGHLGETSQRMIGLSAELAQGSTSQAASLEQTSAALEEMASMTRQNADHAQNASNRMTATSGQIRQGSDAVGDMTQAMSAISESSEQISRIIKTIEDIAFQTNLLALNAAVEAARAGEAGKGFAVVADEVRNLAQRSAQAARDTTSLITSTVERVGVGSRVVEQINRIFKEIAGASAEIERLVNEIAAATHEQAQGVDQVNNAVAQMDKVTQSTAARAEEAAGASREIAQQTQGVRAATGDLQRILGGQAVAGEFGGDRLASIAYDSAAREARTAPVRLLGHSMNKNDE